MKRCASKKDFQMWLTKHLTLAMALAQLHPSLSTFHHQQQKIVPYQQQIQWLPPPALHQPHVQNSQAQSPSPHVKQMAPVMMLSWLDMSPVFV